MRTDQRGTSRQEAKTLPHWQRQNQWMFHVQNELLSLSVIETAVLVDKLRVAEGRATESCVHLAFITELSTAIESWEGWLTARNEIHVSPFIEHSLAHFSIYEMPWRLLNDIPACLSLINHRRCAVTIW